MKTHAITMILAAVLLFPCAAFSQDDETVLWQARSGHRMAAFQDALYITGGLYAFQKNFFFNDTWVSGDGASWSNVTTEQPYTPSRQLHSFLVFQEQLWIMGGQSNAYLNDVWRSADGVSWEMVLAAAPWSPRRGMAAVVHNNRLFMLGGEDSAREYNSDVWVSDDGVAWELLTSNPGWQPRWELAAVSLNNAMFVLGGAAEYGKFNDVWRSSDGVSWMKVGNLPAGIRGHCAEVFKNKIFVFGGVNEKDKLLNEVWMSEDGITWEIAEEFALWPARTRHASAVHKNRLWLAGGTGEEGDLSDVWRSRDGVDWQVPTESGICGCTCQKAATKSLPYFLGDLLLFGVSLLVLLRLKR